MSAVVFKSSESVSVNPMVLRAGQKFEFDIFAADRSNAHIRSIRKGIEISEDLARYISTADSLKLYVRDEDLGLYRDFLTSVVDDVSLGEPDIHRDAAVVELVRGTFRDAMETKDNAVLFGNAQANANRIVLWLSSGRSLRDILNVLVASSEWLDTSINVALLSSFYASAIGAKGKALTDVAIGSLLADIGKLDLDPELLANESNLAPAESRKLEAHVNFGLRRIASISQANMVHLMIAYQHHERPDGKGYPVGVPSELILDAAKMFQVVDKFVFYCGNRHPYDSNTITEALIKMENEEGTRIGKEHFQCWKSIVQRIL